MSVTELKAAFADLAATVTPDPDPYPALRRRWRARRRLRLAGFGATALTVLAGALFGPGLLGTGAPTPDQGLLVMSEWARRLIDSPTRGNLAGDTALVDAVTKEFDGAREGVRRFAPGTNFDRVKVLFVHDFASTRTAVVAQYNDSEALVVHASGPSYASPSELVRSSDIVRTAAGFLVFPEFTRDLDDGTNRRITSPTPTRIIGLAPAGCEIMTSSASTVAADGSIARTWKPSPTVDYVAAVGEATAAAWRITCDGEVRQVGPGVPINEIGIDESTPVMPSSANDVRGTVDETTARTALAAYQGLVDSAGMARGGPQVRWGGSLTTGADPATAAVLIGPAGTTGPLVLLVGAATKVMVATDGDLSPRPQETDDPRSRAEWSLVSTSVATSRSLIAVRVPVRTGGHADLGGRILVVGPRDAVTVEAADGAGTTIASGPLTDGAGVVAVPYGLAATLRVLASSGETLGSIRFPEMGPAPRLFNDQFYANW